METLNNTIALALESGRLRRPPGVLTARKCMTQDMVTTGPERSIGDAMELLLRHGISGLPVVEGNSRLVGMLTELDCLRTLASGSYDSAPFERGRRVRELMSRELITIEPDVEVFTIVELFERHFIRQLPVVEGGILIGQVGRREVLRQLQRLG